VAGKLGAVADSKVRLIGGDFQAGSVFGDAEQVFLAVCRIAIQQPH